MRLIRQQLGMEWLHLVLVAHDRLGLLLVY